MLTAQKEKPDKVLQKKMNTFYEPVQREQRFSDCMNIRVEVSAGGLLREWDPQEFFQHVYQPFLAALSDNGKPHACQKSQLVSIL